MAVTSRDVLLILRAKDEASRVISQVGRSFHTLGTDAAASAGRMIAAGSALVSVGALMTGGGIAMLALAKNFVDTSIQYRQQVALTLTQVDGYKTSIEDLAALGRRVASDIPVPFEEVQKGLYDIFSSLDVNVAEAEVILRAFSKGAVAGQVDLQAAGRATIAILNAWGMSADDVGKVMDVQFQLVRKGVGTYEEFASTIGLSIPAAVRAGQTVENLAGMLAFLTRNGLSASSASVSAGRALETMAHPTVVKRMEDLGIAVRNSKGEFNDITDIVAQLSDKFSTMTAPERAEALTNLFKGAGNSIQARRFWDLALSNAEDFIGLTDDMHDAAGAMDAAYDIMFVQPQTQMQLFKNNLMVLKDNIGTHIIPMYERLLEEGNKVLQWFNDLPPSVHEAVAQVLVIGGALATVVGALSGFVGTLLLFGGFIKLFGGLAAVMSIGLKFLGIIGLIAGAAYLIYKNWDSIKPMWDKYWPQVQAKAEEFLNWLKDTWDKYWPEIRAKLEEFLNWLKQTWDKYWPEIKQTVLNVLAELKALWEQYWPEIRAFIEDTLRQIQAVWDEVWPALQNAVQFVHDWIVANWPTIEAIFREVADSVVIAIESIIEYAQRFWDKIVEVYNYIVDHFGPGVIRVWESIQENLGPILENLAIIIEEVWRAIWVFLEPIVKGIAKFIMEYWDDIYNYISNVLDVLLIILEGAWNTITIIIDNALQIIRGILEVFAGLLTGDWERMWEGIKNIFGGFRDAFTGLIGNFFVTLWRVFDSGMDVLKDLWIIAWGLVKTFFTVTVLGWIGNIGESIIESIGDLGSILWGIGWSVIDGLWQGMKKRWESVTGWLTGLATDITSKKGPPSYDAQILTNNGKLIMQGLQRGMEGEWVNVERWLGSLAPTISAGFPLGATPSYSPTGGSGTMVTISDGAIRIEIGSVSGQDDVDKVERVVNDAFNELLRELSQPRHGR